MIYKSRPAIISENTENMFHCSENTENENIEKYVNGISQYFIIKYIISVIILFQLYK